MLRVSRCNEKLNRDWQDTTMLPVMQHQFAYNHGRKRVGVRFLHCIPMGM